MRQHQLKERIIQAAKEMDLPAELILGMPSISLDGDSQLLIEKHHGLVEYTDTCIIVAAKNLSIHIKGADLNLLSMNSGALSISGRIDVLELVKPGKER